MIPDIIVHGLELRIVDKSVRNSQFEQPVSKDERAIVDGEIEKTPTKTGH